MNSFITFMKEVQCLTSVAEVRHSHIRAWVVSLMQAGQSPRSINRRLSCLKSYFKFLKKRSLLDKDPMKKVVSPRTGKRLPVVVQESQMAALFENVSFPPGYPGALHRLILEILYATGMRRSELAKLQMADVDLDRQVMRITGKGNKQRLAPFAPYLGELIQAFLRERSLAFPASANGHLLLNQKGAPMLPESIYYVVRKYLSLVSSDEQRSPHVLRHSFATHLSNRGADLNAIKELLGHANLAATQIYMHNDIERLRKVYEQAHPNAEEE